MSKYSWPTVANNKIWKKKKHAITNWYMQSAWIFLSHVSTHYGSKIRNYSENSDKINRKTTKYSHYEPIKYFENHIFTILEGSVSWKSLSYQQSGSYQLFRKRSVHRTKALCAGLCSEKIEIASDGFDEIKRSKDQKLSTLNFPTPRTIYKILQSIFGAKSAFL